MAGEGHEHIIICPVDRDVSPLQPDGARMSHGTANHAQKTPIALLRVHHQHAPVHSFSPAGP